MKYSENDIYQIVDLYNYYLSSEFFYEGEIELIHDGYCAIEGTFHKWSIVPICIGSYTFNSILLRDIFVGDILDALNKMPIDQNLELNKEIIRDSLQ